MFVPIATCSPFHDGRRSSARTTSGALTLTTISRSKSRPASKSRYVWVGRAKQLWLTTPLAMKCIPCSPDQVAPVVFEEPYQNGGIGCCSGRNAIGTLA